MKKWHMEGIINGANNTGKKLIILKRDQMYLSTEAYSFQSQKKSHLQDFFRNLAAIIYRRKQTPINMVIPPKK